MRKSVGIVLALFGMFLFLGQKVPAATDFQEARITEATRAPAIRLGISVPDPARKP